MASFTFHTLERCKTWPSYHASYYAWMVRYRSPLLSASNYNAGILRLSLQNVPTHRISYDQPDVPYHWEEKREYLSLYGPP